VPVDKQHFANFLYDLRTQLFTQRLRGFLAKGSVSDNKLDLDQFVIADRSFKLGAYAFAKAVTSNRHDGTQSVANAAKALSLV